MIAQVRVIIVFDDRQDLLEHVAKVLTKEDGALLGDRDRALHQALPNSRAGLGGNLARVSPELGLVTTLGFLGRQSTFSDGFLLVDG